nr:immunoglobulin light chain junction region [Macaca mulatta]
CQHYYRTPSSF